MYESYSRDIKGKEARGQKPYTIDDGDVHVRCPQQAMVTYHAGIAARDGRHSPCTVRILIEGAEEPALVAC